MSVGMHEAECNPERAFIGFQLYSLLKRFSYVGESPEPSQELKLKCFVVAFAVVGDESLNFP